MCSLAIRFRANRHLVGSFFLFVCFIFLSFRLLLVFLQVLSLGSLCFLSFLVSLNSFFLGFPSRSCYSFFIFF